MEDQNFFNYSQGLFKLFRCWSYRQDENKTPLSRFHKWMVTIFAGTSMVLLSLSESIEEIRQGKVGITYTKAIFLAVCVCTHKTFAAIFNDDEIYYCIKKMERLSSSFKNKSDIHQTLRLYKKLFVMGICSVNFCAITFAIAPLLSGVYRPLVYTPNLPYIDIQKTPIWQFLYAYECIGAFIIASVTIAYDTLFCGMMCVGSGILSSICREVREFDDIAEDHLVLEKKMKDTIDKLCGVTELTERISDTFSLTTMTNMFYNCNTIALGLYMLTTLNAKDLTFVSVVSLIIMAVFQLWIYCYFGQKLVNQRDVLRRELYFIRWYDAPRNFKFMLLLTICSSQRDQYVCAGKIMPLSLDTFATVIQNAYAFFTFVNESG